MSNTSMNTEYANHRLTDGSLQNLKEFLNATPGIGDDVSNGRVTSTGSTTTRILSERFADVVNVKDFGAVGDGVVDDTTAIQSAINYAATNLISKVYIPSGSYNISRLWLTYDSVNNTGYPNAVRSGWNLELTGDGKLSSSDVSQIDVEVGLSGSTVLISNSTTDTVINGRLENPSTIQAGTRLKNLSVIANSNTWIAEFSATPESRLFDNVSFYQKSNDGNGVICEDIWFTSINGLSISLPDYTGPQTGTALIMRNRLFAGGGLWQMSQIDIRGGREQFEIGYMIDTGVDIKLLDALVIDTLQCRNGYNGLKIGGKVRSGVISGYHTESNKNLGIWIKSEAKNILFDAPYLDCAECATASVLLGADATGSGSNLDTTAWSNIEFNKAQFQATNAVGLKIFNGTTGRGLTLKDCEFVVGAGAGTVAIDLDNFRNGVYVENITYDAGFGSNITDRPVPSIYISDETFSIFKDVVSQFSKSGVVSKTIVGQLFLSALDSEYLYITPSAGNERVVTYDPTTLNAEGRKHIIKNASGSDNINIRDYTNTTTLFTVAPGETVTMINNGTDFLFF